MDEADISTIWKLLIRRRTHAGRLRAFALSYSPRAPHQSIWTIPFV